MRASCRMYDDTLMSQSSRVLRKTIGRPSFGQLQPPPAGRRLQIVYPCAHRCFDILFRENCMLELEALSTLIATVYDATLDPDVWPGALEGIRSFVRGCAANFYWQEVSKENAGVFHCVGIEPART